MFRTFDRANRIYNAMILRGFNGEFITKREKKIDILDILYLCCWLVFFIIARYFSISLFIGKLMTGVLK